LQVLDDSKPAEAILELRRADELPIRYALVLDLSASGRGSEFVHVALAAVDFLRKALRPGLDHAEVVAFRSDVSEAMAFQPDELSSQPRKAAFKGGTALYDGLWSACQDLTAAKADRERGVILLLSDGDDNQSHHTFEEVRQAALRAGVTVFTINTGRPGPWDLAAAQGSFASYRKQREDARSRRRTRRRRFGSSPKSNSTCAASI
jgi:uncharacterized protein with von Willebrand factor type A (vWA) domain